MKQAKGVVRHMEENKNNFENTEEVMTEQTGAGDAPVTQQPEEQQAGSYAGRDNAETAIYCA